MTLVLLGACEERYNWTCGYCGYCCCRNRRISNAHGNYLCALLSCPGALLYCPGHTQALLTHAFRLFLCGTRMQALLNTRSSRCCRVAHVCRTHIDVAHLTVRATRRQSAQRRDLATLLKRSSISRWAGRRQHGLYCKHIVVASLTDIEVGSNPSLSCRLNLLMIAQTIACIIWMGRGGPASGSTCPNACPSMALLAPAAFPP